MSVISEIGAIKKTVVYIYSGEVHGVHPLGTGFFVSVPHHTNKNVIWPYFVTATHVLKDDSGKYLAEIFLRVNLKGWFSSSNQTGVSFLRLPVLDGEGNLQWTVHSNPAVDLALIQRFQSLETYEFSSIPATMFATDEVIQREGVAEGDEIFFPCFTPEIQQERRNNPVIRFGKLALMSGENISISEGNTKFHFAECFPFGGNSGSPVFLRFGTTRRSNQLLGGQERYFLLGIMKGHYGPSEIRYHIGIAAITPVNYLKEILESDTLRRQRSEIQ